MIMEALMTTHFPDVSDETIACLIDDMNEVGYGSLSGYLSEEQIKSARDFLSSEVKKNNDQYFMYNGYDKIAGTVLHELGESTELKSIFLRLLKAANAPQGSMEHPYAVIRCLKGQSGLKKAYKFHFDAYVLTMLVPIAIPTTGGKTGDLLIYPNLRGIRSSAVINVVEKFLYQNHLTTTLLREMITRGFLRPRVLKLVPGNVYFFWGYQSLHANEPCEMDALRATAIFHLGQPHTNSSIVKLIERRNQRRNQRQSAVQNA